MSVYLSPLFGAGGQLFTNQGVVLASGFVSTYQAGTTTPIATYIDNTQTTQNAVAIPLNSAGRPPNEIWLLGGQAYKFIVTDANGVQVGPTWDNIAGINDPANGSGGGGGGGSSVTVWAVAPATPTYISATQFSVPGNLTSTFPVGTRVKSTVTAGTAYSTVSASAFGAFTTVTLLNDGTTLDSGLSVVATSVNTVTNPNVGAGAVKYDPSIANPAGSIGLQVVTLTTNLAAATKSTVTGGISTAYTLTPVPAITSYVTGQSWLAQANVASTGSPTINISGIGVKNLKQLNGAGAKIFATLVLNAIYILAYDGTDVMVMNATPAGSGKLNRITNINASGTWTKQADTTTVVVKLVGGGGGGNSGTAGSGGGYAEVYVTAPGATEVVTIGGGGATGVAGTSTSFGAWAVATGGGAGAVSSGGVGTTGDVLLRGFPGENTGGASLMGGGAPYDSAAAAGVSAQANSGGGGSRGTATGGVGGSGRIVVYEYG